MGLPKAGTIFQRYNWHVQTDNPTLGGVAANLTPNYRENTLGHRSGGTLKASAYGAVTASANWWYQLRVRGNPENE